jgi:cellulose synthase/poly-beta-1,6-N-acetylglucosamine synthase-like glycosyltransferase
LDLQGFKEKKYKMVPGTGFISTIYNEEKSLPAFLKSFFEQDYLPEEMIFVDGGSTDKTVDILKFFFLSNVISDFGCETSENSDFSSIGNIEGDAEICGSYEVRFYSESIENQCRLNVLLLRKKNAKISEGRNIAIKNSRAEIICVSDAGCILDKKWIFEITRFLQTNNNSSSDNKSDLSETDRRTSDVAGGYSKPVALSFLEKILSMCIMPQLKEINAASFMPSSRNLGFKKYAWAEVGGYPENMDYGEDMKFNFNLKKKGYKILFNPDAIVFWRMRENLSQIFKQFFRYAKGDALGKMYFNRHLIRFSSLIDFLIVIVISIIFSPWFLLILAPVFVFYVFKPFSRLNVTFCHVKQNTDRFFLKIAALFIAPLMLIYIDIAKMFGFAYGLVKK